MNIRFLETLVWLTRLRSFGRTAKKLNATQPAISNRINKLEESLGVRLYDRAARQFELTPAGRRVLRYAEEIVDLSSEMCQAALGDEDVNVQVRVGVIEMVTMSWLPLFLERVTRDFSNAVLEIGTGTTSQLVEWLREDRMDLIFVVGPVNEPHMLSLPICNVSVDWVANAAKFDCETEIDVVELSRMPLVLQRTTGSGYNMLIEYFRSYGIQNVPAHDRKLVIDCAYSIGTGIQLVRHGLGIMAFPLFLLVDDLAAGTVARMKVRQKLAPYYITACCKQPSTNRSVDRLIDLAIDAARTYAEDHDRDLFWV